MRWLGSPSNGNITCVRPSLWLDVLCFRVESLKPLDADGQSAKIEDEIKCSKNERDAAWKNALVELNRLGDEKKSLYLRLNSARSMVSDAPERQAETKYESSGSEPEPLGQDEMVNSANDVTEPPASASSWLCVVPGSAGGA